MIRRGGTAAAALLLGTVGVMGAPTTAQAGDADGICRTVNGKVECYGTVQVGGTPGGGSNSTGGGDAGGGGGQDYSPSVYTGPTIPQQFFDAINTCAGDRGSSLCVGTGKADLGKLGTIGFGIDPATGFPVINYLEPVNNRVVTQAIDPGQVAQMAYAKITLPKPTIGSAPCTRADCKGAVGLPVWLWTDPGEWAPQTASASLGGVTVNVNASLHAVTWSMGDGGTVTCTKPGTKYSTAYGFSSSPDCGYKYLKHSLRQPGGRYTLRAVATYDVVFSGAHTATLNPTTSSSTTVAITEYQAIVER